MILIKVLKIIGGFLVIAFMVTYIIGKSGYYEYQLSNKRNLTEEQIKKFEEDVRNGVDVDLEDYTQNERVDYSSPLSRTTYKISSRVNSYLKKAIESTFKMVNKLVSDG